MTDEPREVRAPFTFDERATAPGDFRPNFFPEDKEEEKLADPKDLSAQEPASSSSSYKPKIPELNVPAAKANGKPKEEDPGQQTSSVADSAGKTEQPATA